MATILTVRDLYKSFGGVKAVRKVSFELAEGQLLAMIGPNGAGKSTCFNLINGQLRPDHGDIVIMGNKINGSKPRDVWKLGVGRTFQITSTFASMSVLENVWFPLRAKASRIELSKTQFNREIQDKSYDILAKVGLAKSYRKYLVAVPML